MQNIGTILEKFLTYKQIYMLGVGITHQNYFLYTYKKNELCKTKRGVSILVRKPKIYKS
jgi:hypothetical protein